MTSANPPGFGTGSKIRKVTTIGECQDMHWRAHGNRPARMEVCGRAIVLVELENGATTRCHDDGSFIEWTGEQTA